MLVFMTSKSDFRCLDIKDHRNHRRKAVVMNGSSINNPSTQDIEEGKKKKVLRQEDCKYQGTAVSDTYWDSVFKKGKRKEEKRRSEGRREAENGEDRRRTQSPPMCSSSGPFNIHQPWWNHLLARAFGFLTTLSLAPVESGLLLEARSPFAYTTWEKQTCEQG